jgi:hypothetical protein
VTEDRGALNHAAIVAYAPEYELHAIGRCTHVLAERMRQCARANADRIQHVGIDEYVPFSRIQRSYTDEFWLCGLALFPPTPHYQRKELTKFFEYMQAGLPIVCSEFSTWRALVEEEGIGLCVPPDDVVRIVEALAWLRSHPIEAAAMGERGRRLIQERFNWESQAAELRRLYDAILPRQGARHPS